MPRYEIRLACATSDTLTAAVPEMTAIQLGPGTLLIGELRDHSELQSALARLSDMGLEIDEFRKLD